MTEPASRELPHVPPAAAAPPASPAPPVPSAPARRQAPVLTWLATTLHVPLYRNGAALVLNSGVTALLGLAYWLLAAHEYSAHAVGVNTAAISAMMFLAGVAQLNLMSALVRFVPILRGARGRFIAVCYATAAAAAIACAAVFLVGIGTWAPALGVLGSGPAMVGWFVGATVIWCVFNLQDSAMTGLDAAVLVPAENTVYGVAKIVLLVALASVSPALGIFASWTAGLLFSIVPVNLAIFTVLLRRRIPEPDAAVKVPTPREIVHFVAPDYLAALLWLAATTLMPVIVVAVAGATSNAYFSLAWMIILPIGAVSASMGVALVATASSEPHRLPEYARSTMRRTARLVIPAALLVAVASPWVVRLFGRQYAHHASLTLSLLALSVIPGMVTALYTSIYRVQRHMRRVVAIQAGLCISVLILGPVLLTIMGPAGVGLAWLVCQSVMAIIILSLDPIALRNQRSRLRSGGRDLAALATARVPLVRRVAHRHLYPLARCVPPGMVLTGVEAVTDVVVGRARAVSADAGHDAVFVRLALTPHGDESVDRALRQLAGLAADARLADWEVAVPRVLEHDRLRGRLYIVESGVSGVPMAKALAGGAPWNSLAQRAIAAVDGLHRRTAETLVAPASLLDHWVGEPARAIEELVSRSPRRVRALRELSANLAAALDGHRVRTSWTHGDFVPGNVLVDNAGEVTGIIDWEMGSTPNLPALDRMMLLLATHTQLERIQLGELVTAIAGRRAPAPLWSALDRAARTGPGQPLDVQALTLLCWLRHAASHATFRERSARLVVWRHYNVDPVLDAWRPR